MYYIQPDCTSMRPLWAFYIAFILGCHHQFVSAQIQTVPLWDTNNTVQLCRENHMNDGAVELQGNAYHSCSIQILAPLNNLLVIETSNKIDNSDVFFYVERMRRNDFSACHMKYVLIEVKSEGCSVAFMNTYLTLVLFGNVNVSVRAVTTSVELKFECPELTPAPGTVFQCNNSCQSVEGYQQLITCSNQYDYYNGNCEINFPPGCSSFIGKKEVRLECRGTESLQGQILLLVIPPSTTVLQLVNNEIAEIDPDSFQHLTNVIAIHLYYNPLVELPNFVFRSMTRLQHLYLSDNELHTLHPRVFEGLENSCIWLDLFRNNLKSLDVSLFHKLIGLVYLSLDENNLIELPEGLFKGLGNLKELTLSINNITSLSPHLFRDLKQLDYLHLGKNELTTLPVSLIHGLYELRWLQLHTINLAWLNKSFFDNTNLTHMDFSNNHLTDINDLFVGRKYWIYIKFYNNAIVSLKSRVFQDLTSLLELNLMYNFLTELPVDLFYGLQSLDSLLFTWNPLNTIDEDTFNESHLPNLVHINIAGNGFRFIPRKLFKEMHKLKQLFIGNNKIQSLPYDLLHGSIHMITLSLHTNLLEDLDARFFKDMKKLFSVSLNNNKLKHLRSGIFEGLHNLSLLLLSHNQLSQLDSELFKDLTNLTYLELQNNKLSRLPSINNKLSRLPSIINSLTKLTYLNIGSNFLTYVDTGSFAGLPENVKLYVSQQEICACYVSDIFCSAADDRSPYLTCDRLLSDRALVVLMWLIGINALGGNIFVIGWRHRSPQKNKVQDTLLSNLALSDLLMGVYMMIIASADIYFGQHFPMQSESWRSGITCRFAGALSIISMEASVFFVTLISIDRFICIRFPFSVHKLSKRSVTVTSIVLWFVSFALGVIPSWLSGRNFKFYDNSHVCIGLPLALLEIFKQERTLTTIPFEGFYTLQYLYETSSKGIQQGLYFSTAVFLGLNCLCYFIICACYVEIIRSVLKSSRQAKLNKEMRDQVRMTVKVAAIVGTDFCCWFPVIVLGILVQARVVVLPPSVFAWCVTFVMPINSAINPYLYTISAIVSDRKQKNAKKQAISKESHVAATVSQKQAPRGTENRK